MTATLSLSFGSIAFFGRSLADYRAMFGLSDSDLRGMRVLDCGAGAASFAAEAPRACGARVTAVDPYYGRSEETLRALGEADLRTVLTEARRKPQLFSLEMPGDFDELEAKRRRALEGFLADYPAGLAQGRYRAGELPELPFADGTFDLALCGHLLFTYADRLDVEFHRLALLELARVARVVRVYPLVDLSGTRHPDLPRLVEELTSAGIRVSVREIPRPVFKGASELLVLRSYPR